MVLQKAVPINFGAAFLLTVRILPSYWLLLFTSGFIAGCSNSAIGIFILGSLLIGIRF